MIDDRTTKIQVLILKNLYLQTKNKCHFYDIPLSEVISLAFEKFMLGEFDKELNISKD